MECLIPYRISFTIYNQEGKMKNRMMAVALIALVAATAVFAASCGGDKYADAKKLMADAIAANEAFVKSLNDAKDAKAVAAAITAWGKSFEAVSSQIENLDKKYPELGQNPPKDMLDLSDKYEKSAKEAAEAALAKVVPFVTDPEVMKAMQSVNLK
jgi:hypothetical protein